MCAAKSLQEYKSFPVEPPSGCYYFLQLWLYGKLVVLENFLHVHLWKIFSLLVLLALLCFGLKMATTQVDFYKLWVDPHSALAAELEFPAQALRNAEFQRLDPMFGRAGKFQQQQTQQSSSPLGGPPGSEFLNSVEAVIQTVDYQEGEPGLLNPKALRDHIDLLIKIHRLEVTVHKSKWKLEDLCRRAELPALSGMSHIQSYVEDIIPCLVVTPADCFYEGSNALAPGKVIHVPWFNNQFMLQWPNLNPLALLRELQSKYENQSRPEVEALVDLLLRAGVDQGYLTRPCLDPTDLSCPKQSPNHRDSPPDVARILSAGCPGFASNILHWPRDIIVGGRRCSSTKHAANENFTVPCSDMHPEESGRLMTASTLQSLILLRSPMDLYRTVYQNDPYKLDVWTLADAQNVLDQWRDGLKQLLIVHNQAIAPALPWRYSTLTDNSVRELFSQNTYQIPVVKILGAVFLMLLYSLLCLLGWREPSRSQCWLALFGLALSVLALLAGLGVCAIFGLHFNILTVQVLPFLALGLGMEGLFTFTTCHSCMLARGIAVARKNGQPNITSSSAAASATPRALTEHGTGLIFGALAMSAAFFSAVVIPVPLVKQFSLQAGILVLIQSGTVMLIFPVLLKLDVMRRAKQRMDVLCCLRQTVAPLHLHSVYPVVAPTPTASDRPASPASAKPVDECGETVNAAAAAAAAAAEISFSLMPLIESASAKVRLHHGSGSGGAFSTLKVSVSTKPQPTPVTTAASSSALPPYSGAPSAAADLECKNTKLGDCLCASCQPALNVDGREGGKRPLLARAAGTLAHLLFRFWPLRLFICLLGLVAMITVAVLVPLRLKLGLDLLRLAPQGSIEREFMAASGRALGLCNFDLIARGTDLPSTAMAAMPAHARTHTGDVTISTSAASVSSVPRSVESTAALSGPGIDFASSQTRLRELYRAISDLPGVSLNGQRVWLDAMADWLETVQAAFDRDRNLGHISSTGFWTANASALGVLGLHLIVQTNHGLQLDRIITARLVTNRIVDPTGFNIFLRVWRNHDILNYTGPPCVIFPDPGLGHDLRLFMPTAVGGGPHDLSPIRPAVPTEYVQTSFFASGYATVESQIELVKKIRQLTERATAQGVPVFPIGSLFTIADQHLRLWRHLGVAVGALTGFVLVLGLILLPNPVAALLAVLVGGGGAICACFAGLFCLGLDLNPISACLLLISFGIGSKLSAGVITSWYGPQHNIHRLVRPNDATCGDHGYSCHDVYTVIPPPKETPTSATSLESQIGPWSSSAGRLEQRQSRRLTSLLQNHMGPVLHALVSLFLAVAFLGGSSVDFVADHFFRLVGLICVACLFDTLLFLPVIFCTLERIWPSSMFAVIESPQPLQVVHSRNPRMRYEDCSLLQLSTGLQSGCSRRQPTIVEGQSVSFVNPSSSSSSPDVGAAAPESAAANTNSAFHQQRQQQQQSNIEEEEEDLGGEDSDEAAMREFYDCLKYASSSAAFLRGGGSGGGGGGRGYVVSLSPAPPAVSGSVMTPMRSASRPSSLSTILEEPSHSSSTVSLHQLDSPRSATDSSGGPPGGGGQRSNSLPAHAAAAASSPEAWFQRIFAVAAAAAGAATGTPAACHLSIKYPLDFSGAAGRGQPPLPLLPPAQVKELIEAFMRSSQIRPEDLTPFSCPQLVPPPPPYSSVVTSAPPSSVLRSRVRAAPSEEPPPPPPSFLPQVPSSSSHPSTSSSSEGNGNGSSGC